MLWQHIVNALHFRRREILGGVAMLLTIILLVIANILASRGIFNHQNRQDSIELTEYEAFEARMAHIDSLKTRKYRNYDITRHTNTRQRDENYFRNDIRYTPAPFDPNSIDSASLVKMGVSQYVAGNVMRYRRKGGVYRTPEHFSRTYGLDSEAFEKLRPAIAIPADSIATKPKFTNIKIDTIIELNNCDTADLMKLSGIGSYTARQIIHYRTSLGGFYSPEQIKEIDGISPKAIDTLLKHSTIDTTLIRRININRASVGQMRHHPYLTFDKAKAIYDLRRNAVSLKNVEDIKNIDIITDADINRLKHYLTTK